MGPSNDQGESLAANAAPTNQETHLQLLEQFLAGRNPAPLPQGVREDTQLVLTEGYTMLRQMRRNEIDPNYAQAMEFELQRLMTQIQQQANYVGHVEQWAMESLQSWQVQYSQRAAEYRLQFERTAEQVVQGMQDQQRAQVATVVAELEAA